MCVIDPDNRNNKLTTGLSNADDLQDSKHVLYMYSFKCFFSVSYGTILIGLIEEQVVRLSGMYLHTIASCPENKTHML